MSTLALVEADDTFSSEAQGVNGDNHLGVNGDNPQRQRDDGDDCVNNLGGDVNPCEGCSGNFALAIFMGCFAAMFSCLLPCGITSLRAQKRMAARFLDRSNEKVCRVNGYIRDKKMENTWHDDGNGGYNSGISLTVIIEFEAHRFGGAVVPVRANVGVGNCFWSRVEIGSTAEVAYKVDNVTDFVIVDEIIELVSRNPCDNHLIVCFIGCFTLIGVAVGLATIPLTGCVLGVVAFVAVNLAAAAAGNSVCIPLARATMRTPFNVSTSGAPTPSESLQEFRENANEGPGRRMLGLGQSLGYANNSSGVMLGFGQA